MDALVNSIAGKKVQADIRLAEDVGEQVRALMRRRQTPRKTRRGGAVETIGGL
jgi:hypothetical protein